MYTTDAMKSSWCGCTSGASGGKRKSPLFQGGSRYDEALTTSAIPAVGWHLASLRAVRTRRESFCPGYFFFVVFFVAFFFIALFILDLDLVAALAVRFFATGIDTSSRPPLLG